MNHRPGHARAAALLAALAVGALALTSCATTAVVKVPPRLSGTPAISISVPLSEVSCTLNDVCVAAGSASGALGPTSVAEFSSPKGHWFNLVLPSSGPDLLSSVACSGKQCLLGGSRPGHDLLWLFDSHTHALAAVTPPVGGIGVSALTCDATQCAMIDTATTGEPRFSLSDDAGATWSTPNPLAWAKGDAVTTFSCGSSLQCAIGVITASHHFALYVTVDGGATWSERVTPSSWTTLTSLTCEARRCEGLATTNHASLLVRTTTFADKWKSTELTHSASALACFAFRRCVVVGQRSNGEPWLATVRGATDSRVVLRYVPSPLLGVACGSKVCAAIAVTTVLSVPAAT